MSVQMQSNLQLLTQAQCARRLGVTRQRVNQMVREGLLATVTIDGRVMVQAASFWLLWHSRKEEGK